MIVSSFFPGRIRLRNDVFKDDDIFSALYSAVGSHSAVKKLSAMKELAACLLNIFQKIYPWKNFLP